MDSFGIPVIIGSYVLLITALVIQRLHYRYTIKEQRRGLFYQIREQTRLAKELEQALTINTALKQLLKSTLSHEDSNPQHHDNK